jgi:RHS repeat-associated protein
VGQPPGRRTQVVDSTGTYSFGYDNMARMTSATTDYTFDSTGPLTVQYSYDAASNLTMMQTAQANPMYAYDNLNRLTSVQSIGQSFTIGYDALSRRTSLARLPNGITTSYGYDPVSRLTSVLHTLGSATVDGATYTYDNGPNRRSRTDKRTNVTLTYGYDNIYQLKSVLQGSTTKESYTYDPVGNRLSSLGVSPYTYNTSNELMSTPSGSYTYDNNGNRKGDPSGATYFWENDNRLSSMVLPGAGGTVNFKYDPFGRRIQKSFTQSGTTTTTNYLYDGVKLLERLQQNGTILSSFTNTLNIDEPLAETISGTTSYYEQDGLSSVTSLSNNAGALANTYTYDSFGKLTASSGTTANPFRYTGREFDTETGIYEYRARYYDQNVGRFLSEDPIGFRGGIDFYAYVKNRPTSFVDPKGTCPQLGDSLSNYHIYTCGGQRPEDRCGCNCAYSTDLDKCIKDCENGCFPLPPPSAADACLCLCNVGYQNGYYNNSITYWLCKHGCKKLK